MIFEKRFFPKTNIWKSTTHGISRNPHRCDQDACLSALSGTINRYAPSQQPFDFAGSLSSGQRSLSINIPSVVETSEDFIDIRVFANRDKVVTLGDIATLRRTFKDRVSYSHANSEQSISLFVYRCPEVFLIGTAHEVEALVADLQDTIPPPASECSSHRTMRPLQNDWLMSSKEIWSAGARHVRCACFHGLPQ